MRTRRGERGAAVVEVAISVPLLLLLILLVGEGAALIRTHQLVSNAAREGARISTLPPHRCLGNAICLAQIRQVVVIYGLNNGLTIAPASITINQAGLIATAGPAISSSRVTVTYVHTLQYLPTFAGVPAAVTLAGRAEFRNLY